MSLLSAGKQISLGNDKSFGRGLFVIDPDQAQRKARKQQQYQQQLRIQMEQAKRKKDQQKKRQAEQDKRWEDKFYQEIKNQNAKKNQKPQQKNDKNFVNNTQKSQVNVRQDFNKQQKLNIRKTQQNEPATYNMRRQIDNEPYQNHYSPTIMSYEFNQQQHYYDESSQQKLKMMRQVLDQKMNEVYNKIKQSKNLQIDRQIDSIRRKISSSNNTYESQNPVSNQLPHEFSQFYKIPKKNTYGNQPTVKNLNYDSRVQYKRTDFDFASNNQGYNSRQNNISRGNGFNPRFHNSITSRGQQSQYDQNTKWGVHKGKTNFLGNRQALDYQIQNILNSIDKNLVEHGQN